MQEVQRVPTEYQKKINVKLRPYGLALAGASVSDEGTKASVTIETGSAATFNKEKVAAVCFEVISSFETELSTVVVDGREFKF